MRFSEEEHKQWFNGQARKPMSAAVIFRNEQGGILLVKPNYRDHWNLPGGVVDEHESPLDGAVREVKEELDMTFAKRSLRFCSVDYRPAKAGLTDKLYFYFDGGLLDASSISQINLQAEELDDYRFVPPASAKTLVSPWTFLQIKQALSDELSSTYLETGAPIAKGLA